MSTTSPPKPQTIIPALHSLAHSQAHRVHWALEEIRLANLAFVYKTEHYQRVRGTHPELAKIFKLGKSPILTLETTDGSEPPTVQLEPGVLTESKLILRWLKSEYSNGIWDPETEEDRKRDEFFDEFTTNTLLMKVDFATIFDIVQVMMPFPLGIFFKYTLVKPMLNYWFGEINAIFEVIEETLTEEKPWFAGSKLGISDINAIFPMDTVLQKGWFDGEKYPKLKAWGERVRSREAYKRALAVAEEKGIGYDLKVYGLK